MGKNTGFLDYNRKSNASLPPEERIRNFSEFHPPMEEEKRKEQAARCMNCGVPFCQSGSNFGGMVSGCPLHNLIPEWNDAIYRGNWKEALERLRKTSPFPEFTGRVCPALCEYACTCGLYGDAVTVHDNELAIIETAFQNRWMTPRIPSFRSGKKIAVIGSGPAGLAVGEILNQRGHAVTIFERDKRPGGLLMYGIPNMKLDKSIVERRITLMEAEGVEFRTGISVGTDLSPEELLSGFDAVVLCCGAKKARDLALPGRDAAGIAFAVDYLSDTTRFLTGEIDALPLSAEGKQVLIVGGGDTGNDCVGTCIRQKCKSVLQLEMMPKLPEERTPQNPWPQWKKVCKTDYGQEEAIARFGSDPRIYETTVKEIRKGENGEITAVRTVRLAPETDPDTHRTVMKEIEGSDEELPCDLLLIAAGFVGCEDPVMEAFGIEKTPRGTIATSGETHLTSLPKVFTAGDCRRGQSLVVHAIADGIACAKEVDRFLMGYTNLI